MKKSLGALLFLASALAAFAGDVSLTGTWTVDQDIAGNASSGTVVFKQDGQKLTGVMKGPDGQELKLTGDVSGNKVTWKYTSEWEGNQLTITFSGTIDPSGTITGSVVVDPMGVEGTFSAKRAEEKRP